MEWQAKGQSLHEVQILSKRFVQGLTLYTMELFCHRLTHFFMLIIYWSITSNTIWLNFFCWYSIGQSSPSPSDSLFVKIKVKIDIKTFVTICWCTLLFTCYRKHFKQMVPLSIVQEIITFRLTFVSFHGDRESKWAIESRKKYPVDKYTK